MLMMNNTKSMEKFGKRYIDKREWHVTEKHLVAHRSIGAEYENQCHTQQSHSQLSLKVYIMHWKNETYCYELNHISWCVYNTII